MGKPTGLITDIQEPDVFTGASDTALKNPWNIQHPDTPEATEGAKGRSYPIQMRRGQVLEVVTDAYGRFLSVNELMPPLIPSDRLPGRTREDERITREQEWAQAHSRIQASPIAKLAARFQ